MGVVHPIFKPDTVSMLAHVEHLFGGFLDGFHDGLVELAWTQSTPNAEGRYPLNQAAFFRTDQLEELVEKAAALNSVPMCNVYIGAALRHPDTFPGKRAGNEDAWCLTSVYSDFDDHGAATGAKDKWADAKPTFIVRTGNVPHTRAQPWWRLTTPISDPDQWSALLRGMAVAMGGDTTVCNPGRVMRLAGSIAWPVKDGRTTELTAVVHLRNPGLAAYSPEQMAAKWPPINEMQAEAAGIDTSGVTRGTGAFGFEGEVTDGRDAYMMRTVLAVLVEYIGENGTVPEPQELFDLAWPQFAAHADMTRPGHNTPELMRKKVQYALQRFARGQIKGARTLEEAVASYEEKERRRPFDAGRGEPPPEVKTGDLRLFDFADLVTRDVPEEPDYVGPDLLGPGNFMLIGGPPKAQKSWLLQDLLITCATGGRFLDHFTVARPLRVFWLQAEMNEKLLRRRGKALRGSLSPTQIETLSRNMIVSDRFRMLLSEDGARKVAPIIASAFNGEVPDIVAFDPMANLFDQENENDNAQVMKFLTQRVELVRQLVNPLAGVILVHHATKKGPDEIRRDPFNCFRGGGALRGHYDSGLIIFRQNEEGETREVHFELRAGESPEAMKVRLVEGRMTRVTDAEPVAHEVELDVVVREVDKRWKAGEPFAVKPQGGRLTLDRWLVTKAKKSPADAKRLVNHLVDMEAIVSKKVARDSRREGWSLHKWTV